MKHSIIISKLKSLLPFWQEIVFIIPLGALLIEMTTKPSVIFSDTLSTVCYCLFLFLFVCLAGQFFWKNAALGIYISFIIIICSVAMMLLFLVFAIKEVTGNLNAFIQSVIGLLIFLGFIITATSMIVKHVMAQR